MLGTSVEVAFHLMVIAIVFIIIISIRNKIEYSNKYDTFKKSDGLILLFLFYLLVFFVRISISNVDIRVSYPLPDYNNLSIINWIPFTWISKQKELLEFLNYIDKNNNYYTDFASRGLIKHFAKFVLHLLPISYFTYVLSKKKWLGLIAAQAIGILVVMFSYGYFLGDAIVIILISYILIYAIHRISRLIVKDKKLINIKSINIKSINIKLNSLIMKYALALLLIILGFVLVLDPDFISYYSSEKLIGTINLDEHYEFYDGLVKLNLTHANYYEGGSFDDSIKFNGNLKIDKSLYNYFGNEVYNDIRVKYLYAFYDTNYRMGTNDFDFAKIGKKKTNAYNSLFQPYLELNNYSDYMSSSGNQSPKYVKDDLSKKFFEFKGISGLTFSLQEESLASFYELLDSHIGEDDYVYIDYTYKVKKLNNEEIIYYVSPRGYWKNGQDIRFYPTEEELIEENDDYQIVRERAYIYSANHEELNISSIEVKAYQASVSIELNEEDLLLEFDKEDFIKAE